MRTLRYLILALPLWLASCGGPQPDNSAGGQQAPAAERPAYAMAIHGGAGTILRENITPEQEAEIKAALNAALDIGEEVLRSGGSSRDAVEQAIMYLEDSPLFNAGKGAVFTHEGKNELDASIMDGLTLEAGAVGGLRQVKNPIRAARAVLENSPHVLLTGAGAEQFAIEQGIDTVSSSYFFTQSRWDALQRAKASADQKTGALETPADYKFGTVGCVALDQEGNITAGTSTGGMTNKRYNRFGDVPVIGAGTYADNASCGVSCTGHGEFFIRYAVAHDLHALMAYQGMALSDAADHIIFSKLKPAGGGGGLIAVDKNGNIAMPFNTPGMYRGYVRPDGRYVGLYAEEE